MTILDTVLQLQQSGMSNEQISMTLQSQGVSPREINDAINQAQIKNAVNQAEPMQSPEVQIGQQYSQAPVNYSQYQQQPDMNQQQYSYQDQYPNSYQDNQQQYYQQPSYDTETISDIVEQIVSEKFKEFNKKNGDIALFKSSVMDKISDIDTRLKRIETTIDKLQQSIIQKIGEFGENTSAIRRDVSNLHDTTSKLMNPLIDNYRELQKINRKS
jgi:hypothetical protein